jgi:type IV pilus assembly protein PilC
MKKFDYIVSNDEGVRKKGTIAAATPEEATDKLREDFPIIISVVEKTKSQVNLFNAPSFSMEDKMMFTKHMATMVKVGITITESLEIMADQTEKRNNKKMYESLIERIRAGQSLAQSLREYPKVFSEIFVNMIETGEEAGNLDEVMAYLDVQLEKEYDLRKKIVSAFIYPGVIVSVTMMLMLCIVIFVMPKITDIFSSFDMKLPLPTRILITVSSFITDKPLMALVVTILSVVGVMAIFRANFLKPIWHRVVLYIPVFGKILVYANVARFSRTLNSLLASGVPLTEALTIIEHMMGNHMYQKAINLSRAKVEQGAKLSESLDEYRKIFPVLASRMIYIGETTGNMEVTTDHLARLYEKNVDNITKNLSVLLEPILLVFMGLLIGGFAISIILPIYQLPNMLGT